MSATSELRSSRLARRERLAERLDEQALSGLLVTRMTNIRYLTGFTGTTGVLVMADDPALVVDFRYKDQAGEEVDGVEVQFVENSREVWPATIRRISGGQGSRIGLEANNLPVARLTELQQAAGVDWVSTSDLVEKLRAVKDAGEIASLREAVRLTDEAFTDVLRIIEPGMTEHRLAGEIELRQRSLGGERSASEIIVASGTRSVRPHGIASERRLQAGEPVMFDLGTVVDGYLGDLTRTIHLGPAPDEFKAIYQIVLDAQRLVEERVAPGMTCREADLIARQHISEHGYGRYFGHSLGHAIGLDNHEQPAFSPMDETIIEPGLTVTVEPGIYLPGVGGVRIEDMIVVTEDGCEVLTTSERELIEL